MITDLIFDAAQRTPAKPAIIYNGQTVSYRAFAANIAMARGYFARRGIAGPGLVVLVIANMLDFWVLSLALRSLGSTTIAVQSVGAFDELQLADVRGVVASAAEALPGLEPRCAARGYELFSAALAGEAALGPGAVAAPARPGGHILQTSGTTGVRKKVLMDPTFEDAFMRGRCEVLGVGEDAVVNVFSFGGGTALGYNSPVSAWAIGATVVIDEGRAPHLSLLHPGLTHAMVTPDLLGAILAAPAGAFPRSETLHLSITSGAVTQAQVKEAKARITPWVFNRLGSTEMHTWGNTALENLEDHRWHRLVPGREVQVVDDLDRPVRTGMLGRVRVSAADGPGGYLDDEATTRAFFKDGFFYPGDLGVIREDGRLSLQGRVTDVINLSGHKIMPAPIEERLREALGVSGVCLVSMQDDQGEEQLHLMIETGAPIETAILTGALRRELQGVAGVRVHFAPALPRNATGKVVRREVVSRLLAKL